MPAWQNRGTLIDVICSTRAGETISTHEYEEHRLLGTQAGRRRNTPTGTMTMSGAHIELGTTVYVPTSILGKRLETVGQVNQEEAGEPQERRPSMP